MNDKFENEIKLIKKEYIRDLDECNTNNVYLLQEIKKLRKEIEIIKMHKDNENWGEYMSAGALSRCFVMGI